MLLDVKRSLPCFFFIFLVAVFSIIGLAQEDETYSVDLDGRKTWTLRWGLGDAVGLATAGLAAGQFTLDQSLAVDISGKALEVLSIEAHFDDRQSDNLQALAILLDTERLDGVLGDFIAEGIGGFTAFGKKMKGLQLEYMPGDAVWTVVASKLEGISESKTFVGEKAHEEVTYSAYSIADPPKARPYKRRIDGLAAYPIDGLYVKEFSEVSLVFDQSATLRSVLAEYGLGYLVDTLTANRSFELDEWEFQVVGEGEQTLLLSEEATALVRDRLEAAIDLYNTAHDLSGDEKKEYPFSRNTAFEQQFLHDVSMCVWVAVDDEQFPILDAVRHRFFDLGRKGIVASSVSVEVSEDGRTFDSIDSPKHAAFNVEIFSETGILEADFPLTFFTEESAIRVNFDYTVTGGVFMLGLSIIPESDQVRMNDTLLKRDDDYTIDYEIGMLMLMIDISDTDVIRVDYERFAGGIFGSGADYATYFYGLTLDWPISEQMAIQATFLQSVEDPGSVADPASVKTMPNQHTIAGVSGTMRLEQFDADFLMAYSHDRFPFDDNARTHLSNKIAVIAANEEYVFFGHRSGVTVKRGAEWSTYGTGQGLAGRSVQAAVVADEMLFLGTGAGLTTIRLDGVSPLDRIGNWTSYYADEEKGLPNGSVTALLVVDGVLWVGTEAGMASVRIEEIDEPTAWVRFGVDGNLSSVTSLAGNDETIFLGTEDGAYQYSPASGSLDLLQGSAGVRVHDLCLFDGTLYVASSRGLRTYRDGIGSGWLILGEPVYAVVAGEGFLAVGTEEGLVDVSNPDADLPAIDATITAMVQAEGALWIGTRANADYELKVWSYGESVDAYPTAETGIDGRDPFGFTDADAVEHTIEGAIGRASFRKTMDGFSVWGRVESRSPSYRSIGSLSRSDSTGWDLAATWALGDDADLSISHGYDMVGVRRGEPLMTMANDLSLQWAFGPTLSVNARQDVTNDDADRDGAESIRTSYQFSLSDTLFTDRLDLGISWRDAYSWSYEMEALNRDTQLSFSADAKLLPSWSMEIGWSRPVGTRAEAWSGSESLSVRSVWSKTGGWVDYGLDYELDWSRALPNGESQRNHEVELDLDGTSFDVDAWKITPGATLGMSSDERSVDVDGRIVARGRCGDLSIQTTLRGGWTGLGEPVVRESERLSVNGSYTGIASLHPSLTYTLDRQVVIYASQRQDTIGHSVTGRLKWSPGQIHSDDLSFSLTSKGGAENRTVTARLENSYRIDLQEWTSAWQSDKEGGTYPTLVARLDTDANYRRSAGKSDIDATTTGQLDMAFSPTWSGSMGATYLGGTGSTGIFYHSLMLELTVAIDF